MLPSLMVTLPPARREVSFAAISCAISMSGHPSTLFCSSTSIIGAWERFIHSTSSSIQKRIHSFPSHSAFFAPSPSRTSIITSNSPSLSALFIFATLYSRYIMPAAIITATAIIVISSIIVLFFKKRLATPVKGIIYIIPPSAHMGGGISGSGFACARHILLWRSEQSHKNNYQGSTLQATKSTRKACDTVNKHGEKVLTG